MLNTYKSATTWLQGVLFLVLACVFNLTSVNVIHPKGNVELLLSATFLTTVLRNAVSGRSIPELHWNTIKCMLIRTYAVCLLYITFCVLLSLLYTYGCALLDYRTQHATTKAAGCPSVIIVCALGHRDFM